MPLLSVVANIIAFYILQNKIRQNATLTKLEILLRDFSPYTTYKVRVTGVDYGQNTPCLP